MSLIGVQRRFRELGRIRLGEKGVTKNGKSFPKKLTGFRLTSQSHALLLVAADLYGGEVRKWDGAPGLGDQWELYMGDRIDVLLPPGEPLTQSFELWSGGGCVRRCNGATMVDGAPCQCPADIAERMEMAAAGSACKPTTRLAVILPRIPDIGVWRMETHGYNAAVELPGTVDLLMSLSASGGLIPAFLRIEQRTSVKDGETRHFVVPVLELPTVTVAELMSGNAAPALGAGSTPALTPPPPAAIAAPAPPPPPPAARAPRPRREEAQRPVAAPPLPGDGPSAATADGISGLVERLGVLGDWAILRFEDKFGNPDKLVAKQLVVAEAFVTSLEASERPAAATPPAEDPGRPFEAAAATPPVSDEGELEQVREKSTSTGQAHAPTDDSSTLPRQATPATVSVKQAQQIHINASALRISEEDLDFLIANYTGGKSTSAKDLPLDQLDKLTDEMQRISERPDGAARMATIRNTVLEAAGQQTMAATA